MVLTNSKYESVQKEGKAFLLISQVRVRNACLTENNLCLSVALGCPFLGPGGLVFPGQHSLGHLRLGLLSG